MTDLKPCPFCRKVGEVHIEGKGQIWRGVKGYSDPQYWHLTHFCRNQTDDDYVQSTYTMRARTEAQLITAWNTRTDNWQPIETAPQDGTVVLLCRAYDADGLPIEPLGIFAQVAAWWHHEGWIVYCSIVQEPQLHFKPTHWQPLQPPPRRPGQNSRHA